ncbi:MAG: Lrp/AsnC family transcriptional regulator [Lentisphaeria bacterium]|nr:Lrp/AsnC family transcriptional regulator [Lentisphaeria bacterium]
MAKATNKARILALLKRNARISAQEIADRLNITVEKANSIIKELETEGTVRGYTALISPEQETGTRAIIEVQIQPERDAGFDNIAQRICKFDEVVSAYLVSGRYDLHLEVVGNSLQDVAHFVASKLSTQPGVKSCATLFLLKKYKESGIEMDKEEGHERLKISM